MGTPAPSGAHGMQEARQGVLGGLDSPAGAGAGLVSEAAMGGAEVEETMARWRRGGGDRRGCSGAGARGARREGPSPLCMTAQENEGERDEAGGAPMALVAGGGESKEGGMQWIGERE